MSASFRRLSASVSFVFVGWLSWPDGDLHYAVPLVPEEIVRLGDAGEREGMRDEVAKRESLRAHDAHQASHALLAAGAKDRQDRQIGEAGTEGVERHREVMRVDAQARQRATRAEASQRV